jgi:acetyl-CoA acetyltransferase
MARIRDYSGIAVTTPVTYGYARATDHEVPWYIGGVLEEMMRRTGVAKREIDGFVLATYRLAPDHSASMVEYFGLSTRFMVDLPFGGASGVIALRRAVRAVQCGDAEIVACVGADVAPTGFGIGANFSRFSRDHVYPYGAGGPNAVFAMITQNYMRKFSATREDFGRICVAQRQNGAAFPLAVMRSPISMQEYLSARPISDPLALLDCVMRVNGGEGFLVMAEDRARSLGLPFVSVVGTMERHDGALATPVQENVGVNAARDGLYEEASIGPQDVDFVQAYDDYPVIVMLQLEALGFCAPGEAARFLRERRLTTDGDFPLNTNGGMLAMGQAGAAGGFVGMTEALRQLTGETLGGAVVRDARAGIVSCYGTVNYDRGLCSSAAILTKGGGK